MAYKSVNRAVPRIEGADKVSGNMRYAADLNFPAALAAKILRTSLPHARIVSIDTSQSGEVCAASVASSPAPMSKASWSDCA